MSKTLYEQDFQLWLATTINHLQKREFAALVTDNLIEELTDLGISAKRTLESNVIILLAHFLKVKIHITLQPMIHIYICISPVLN